jgi:hypothetical protein
LHLIFGQQSLIILTGILTAAIRMMQQAENGCQMSIVIIVPNIVLLALTALAAHGRWNLVPIALRDASSQADVAAD